MKQGTLRITWPAGGTILLALALLGVVCAAAEVLARNPNVQRQLIRPAVYGHPQLAYKLQLLDRLETRDGPVDCFLIGSSLVRTGIDPETLDAEYQQVSGKPLHCFNFGLDDVDSVGAAALAQVLEKIYHPALIVYGTSYRDYNDSRGFALDIPWADYWRGQPSFEGWLEANSIAFRYVRAYQEASDGGALDRTHLTVYGFFDGRTTVDVSHPPAKNPDGSAGAKLDMVLAEGKLNALEALAALPGQGTRVVIVEMPQPQMTIEQLSNGQQDYDLFLERVGQSAASYGLTFSVSQNKVSIPSDGWQDFKHMNGTGARVFSRWLGDLLAGDSSQTGQ